VTDKRAIKVLLIAAGLLVAAMAIFGGCYTPNTARRILESEGYTNITFSTYPLSALIGLGPCSNNDHFVTPFVAIKNGMVFEGAVCSGITKGYTIRITRVQSRLSKI